MTTSGKKDSELDTLFPFPSPPPAFAPQRLPGISQETNAALVNALKENHTRWHIFFNDKGFHKYVVTPMMCAQYSRHYY